MPPQHHWFSDNTDKARQWSEACSIKSQAIITANFIIFPCKFTVKHLIVLYCAANTTIKSTISLKITLDESSWMFQTRREKILEARNKEIRLKEKTKVTINLLPRKNIAIEIMPKKKIYILCLSLFFSGNAWSWRTWGKKDWRSHNVMFWKLVFILLCREFIFGQK